MKKLIFTLIVIVVTLFSVSAQEDESNENALPTIIQKTFNTKNPGKEVTNWTLTDNKYFVYFFDETVENEVLISIDGKWLETRTSIEMESIPDEVKNAFQISDYAELELYSVKKISSEINVTYEIKLISEEGEEITISYDSQGKLIGK